MKIALVHTTDIKQEQHQFVLNIANQTNREFLIVDKIDGEVEDFCEENDIDILFISCLNERRQIQQWLNRCRNIRLPYIFLTDTMQHLRSLTTLLSPITMLEEETHKAEILTHLARFTSAETVLLQANDYGSRAEQNTNRIITALQQFELPAKVMKAKKDSFSVVKEAAENARQWLADLLIITASREYGLDDIIFGPQERQVILRSNIPVLLLNPRADLFSLCD